MAEDGTMLNVNELLGMTLLTWLLPLVVLASESAAPAGLTEHALSTPRATSVNANIQKPVNRRVNNFNIRFGFLSFLENYSYFRLRNVPLRNYVVVTLYHSGYYARPMASLVRRACIFIGKITYLKVASFKIRKGNILCSSHRKL